MQPITPVTKPFLPEMTEYLVYIEDIWKRNWLTNMGPISKQLELELARRFKIPYLNIVTNGTIALQLAIEALDLKGSIITTPFSYIATLNSILWEKKFPIFADIDPYTFNIDPAKITSLIRKDTTAILATHCFGTPCAVTEIEEIAKNNNLKIIYDAAHCFGSEYKNKSLFAYGDISTTSFHATKLFHTIEGGAIFSKNQTIHDKIKLLMNFGHNGPDSFNGIGINAKISEFHAAMGITVLNHIDKIMTRRKDQWMHYKQAIPKGTYTIQIDKNVKHNYSYFPIVLKSEKHLTEITGKLKNENIFARRYFYPSLNLLKHNISRQSCPVSEDISRRILCLPLYHDLNKEKQDNILDLLSYCN